MKTKKILGALLAVMMTLVLTSAVSATEPTGSISITNSDSESTYTVYKLFDATTNGSAISYTVLNTSEWYTACVNDATNCPFALNQIGTTNKYAVTLKQDMDIDDVTTWISGKLTGKTPVTNCNAVAGNGHTLTFANLGYGYYYVTTTQGNAISLDSLNGANQEIVDKNEKGPDEFDKSTTTSNWTIGYTADFTITFTAENFKTVSSNNAATSTKITNYTIEDNAGSDLVIDEDSVKVEIKQPVDSGTASYVDITSTATVTYADSKLVVSIPWVDGTNNNNLYKDESEVKITYNAEIMSAGTIDNDAEGFYNVTESFGTDEVQTANFDLTINKVDKDNTSNKLAGAKFKIYTVATGGTAIDLVKTADGKYTVANSGASSKVTEFEVDSTGVVEISGLGSNTYYIEETEAPAGFNPLTSRQAVTVSADNSINVENAQGVELPSTGGMGTTMFYVVGSAMVIGAVILFVTKKRMAN